LQRYFTKKEIVIGAALFAWAILLIWFLQSDKTVGDIFVNLISDIAFAFFVAQLVEQANKKDRDQRSRARQRAVALSVQRFYQSFGQFLTAIIADGVTLSGISALPTPEVIKQRAEQLHSSSQPIAFDTQPTPYGAFFMSEYNGSTQAAVYPARTTSAFLTQIAQQIEPLYLNIFHLDNGFLPDQVVDSLTRLKDLPTIGYAKHGLGPVKFGYWLEDELTTLIINLDVLNAYFAPLLGYTVSPTSEIVRNAILNGLNLKIRSQPA
jgi:hypothetical protein